MVYIASDSAIGRLEREFESIKDKLHPNTMKNNDFVKILSEVYRIDPLRANLMWQDIVDSNSINREENAVRNIYLVYTKLANMLSVNEAAQLLSMNYDRIRILILYSYLSATFENLILGPITKAVLDKGDYLQANKIIELLCDRQESCADPFENFYAITIKMCGYLEKEFDTSENSLNLLLDFYDELLKDESIANEGIKKALYARKSFLESKPIIDINLIEESLSYAKASHQFGPYIDLLYLEKDILNNKDIDRLLKEIFIANHRVFGLEAYCKNKEVKEWYIDYIICNKALLKMSFMYDSCAQNGKYLLELLAKREWEEYFEYVLSGLNQDAMDHEKSYFDHIRYVITRTINTNEDDLECKDNGWKRKPLQLKHVVSLPNVDGLPLELEFTSSIEIPFDMDRSYYIARCDRQDFMRSLNDIIPRIVKKRMKAEICTLLEEYGKAFLEAREMRT